MNFKVLFPIVLLVALLTATGPVNAGPGVWTSSGPNGGRVDIVIASPFTASEFYALANGAVFKSIDGGVSWSEASAGINRGVFQLDHSKTAVDRLLATNSSKVFYSSDGAATWQDRSPPAALLGAGLMRFLTASATLPGTYYVALSDGRILITDDSGLSWRVSTPIVQPTAFSISAIAADPAAPHRVLVATATDFPTAEHRLWVGDLSDPAPPSVWVEVACPVNCLWDDEALTEVEFGSAGRVWAISPSGVGRSDDAGLTWTIPGGLFNVFGRRIAVKPGDNTGLYVAGIEGLNYTTDDGATWDQVLAGFAGNELLQPARSIDVVYNPFDPSRQLAGSESNGVYRRNSTVLDTFVPSVAGLTAQQIRAVASNTLDRVHVGVSDSFSSTFVSFRSTNNGLTWGAANSGLEADQFRALVVDPNDSEVIYAGGRFDPKPDNTGMFVPGNGGLYKSTNGGLNWTTIDSGIPLTGDPPFVFSRFGTVRDIAIDDSVVDSMTGRSTTLYATASGRLVSDGMGGFNTLAARVYKSTDAGATWLPSDTGVGGTEVVGSGFDVFAAGVQIVIDPTDVTRQTLYLATFIGRGPTDEPTTIGNGVFKSIDGGATWTNVTNGLPRINGNPLAAANDVLSLAVDPATGDLYASSNDQANGFLGTVYKSTDGGLNWSFAGTGLENRDVRDLAVDPAGGEVYAAVTDPLGNGDGGVFVSADGGASWSSISTGFPDTAVALKLELDNTGPNLLLHAGTSRGVQSFDVLPDEDTDGATDGVEDMAPAGGRGVAGDGNGDSIPDRLQREVASPQLITATRGTPVTITASLTPISGTCDRLENSFGLGLLTGVPAESTFDSPYSGLHLRIPDCEQAEVEIVYHGRVFDDDPSWQMRGYGLAFPGEESAIWNEVPSASFSGNTWTFVVTDGQLGDATPDDGVIVFQGAAKQLTERFFADSLEAE